MTATRPIRPVSAVAAALVAAATAALGATACTDGPDPLAAETSAVGSPSAGSPVVGSPVAGAPLEGAAAPARHLGPQGAVGQFVVECEYSHSGPDDPIVYPDQPGMSHNHDFFGNVTTDAHSTLESLLAGDTTCQNQLDTAAYWAPTLYDHGRQVVPRLGTAYYRAAPGVDPESVVAFPPGFKIIAGDLTATEDDPRPVDIAGWSCGVSTRLSSGPPTCPVSAPLRAVITFPDCWDGSNIDSSDHRAHMANSADGRCPTTHPVSVPQLTFAITYPVSGPDHELTLASGSPFGIHSDFVNAWHQEELESKVELCIHRDAVCGLSSNRSEDPLFSG